MLTRRTLLSRGAALGGLTALAPYLPAWAQTGSPGLSPDMPTLSGEEVRLTIGRRSFTVGGRTG